MHPTDKYSEHSSIIWPVWPNGLVFFYEQNCSGFESSCSQLHKHFMYLGALYGVCFCMAINCFSELPGFISFGSLGVLTITSLSIGFPWRNAVVHWRNAVMAILLIGYPSDAMPANTTLLPFLEHVDLPVQKSCFSLNPHASFQALRVVINRAT